MSIKAEQEPRIWLSGLKIQKQKQKEKTNKQKTPSILASEKLFLVLKK